MLIPNKILTQRETINITKDEYLMIKTDNRTIVNLFVLSTVSKYMKHKLTKLHGENDNSITTVRDTIRSRGIRQNI